MGRRYLRSAETYSRLAADVQACAYREGELISLVGGDNSSFHRLTRELSDTDRARVFFALPLSVQEACRAEIASAARLRHITAGGGR